MWQADNYLNFDVDHPFNILGPELRLFSRATYNACNTTKNLTIRIVLQISKSHDFFFDNDL